MKISGSSDETREDPNENYLSKQPFSCSRFQITIISHHVIMDKNSLCKARIITNASKNKPVPQRKESARLRQTLILPVFPALPLVGTSLVAYPYLRRRNGDSPSHFPIATLGERRRRPASRRPRTRGRRRPAAAGRMRRGGLTDGRGNPNCAPPKKCGTWGQFSDRERRERRGGNVKEERD